MPGRAWCWCRTSRTRRERPQPTCEPCRTPLGLETRSHWILLWLKWTQRTRVSPVFELTILKWKYLDFNDYFHHKKRFYIIEKLIDRFQARVSQFVKINCLLNKDICILFWMKSYWVTAICSQFHSLDILFYSSRCFSQSLCFLYIFYSLSSLLQELGSLC